MSRRMGWKAWSAYALLCLLASTRWMLVEADPFAASSLLSQALGCAAAAAVAVAAAVFTHSKVPTLHEFSRAVLAGAMLLAGPSAGLLVHARGLSGGGLVTALALTPVVIAVLEAAGRQATGIRPVPLWAGMAGAAALLQVVAMPPLNNPRADMAYVLAPLLTGAGCVLFGRVHAAAMWRMAAALTGGGVLFFLATFAGRTFEQDRFALSNKAVGLDFLLAGLAVCALLRLRPVQYASQFAAVPLLVLMQGLVFLHPRVSVREAAGLVVLAGASVALLRDREEASVKHTELNLR